MHWQESLEVASRKAMCSVLLGNAIADCETHWQEGSEVASGKAIHSVLLQSDTQRIIAACNCRVLDALAGGFRGRVKRK